MKHSDETAFARWGVVPDRAAEIENTEHRRELIDDYRGRPLFRSKLACRKAIVSYRDAVSRLMQSGSHLRQGGCARSNKKDERMGRRTVNLIWRTICCRGSGNRQIFAIFSNPECDLKDMIALLHFHVR